MKMKSLLFIGLSALLIAGCERPQRSSLDISDQPLSFSSSEESSSNEKSSSSEKPSSSKEETVACTFVNYDDSFLWNKEIKKGGDVVYEGPDPVKPQTEQYNFTFSGWDKPLTNIIENTTFKAQYSEETRSYVITFVDENGEVLYKDENALYGTTPSYVGNEPTKDADAMYNYTFVGWTPSLVSVKGDATYVATFSSDYVIYHVVYKNDDGAILADITCHYGAAVPSYSGETPTKASTAQYSYTFNGWEGTIPTSITGDIEFVAKYTETVRTYTVTWVNWNNDVLEVDYNVPYGTIPEYNGETPTREAALDYTWEFDFWGYYVNQPITGDTTFKAMYSGTMIYHTVTWKNEDGTVLKTEQVRGGTIPTYTGEDPTKEGTSSQVYYFDGWDKEVVPCVEDATYTATFTNSTVYYTKNADGTWNADSLVKKLGGSLTIKNTINNIPVTSINPNLFINHDRVTQIHIKAMSLKVMTEGMFNGCNVLSSLEIPYLAPSIKTPGTACSVSNFIGYYFGTAPYTDSVAKTQTINDNNGVDHSYTAQFPSSLYKVTVLSGYILESAFKGLDNISTVDLGDVISVEDDAFRNNTGLINLTCENVHYIGSSAFANCSKLKSFKTYTTVDVHITNTCFDECLALETVSIPNGTLYLGVGPFVRCSALKRFTANIGNRTGDMAFASCTSLEDLTLPFTHKWIHDEEASNDTLFGHLFGNTMQDGLVNLVQSFDGGTTNKSTKAPLSLKKVTIKGGKIFRGTFMNFSMIETMILGANIEFIGADAFKGCTGLTTVKYEGTVAQWQALEKGQNYKQGVSVTTITCSDGTTNF